MVQWQTWALSGALAPLFDELMARHYDPHYIRSQARNFAQWDTRQQVDAPDLSPEGIAQLGAAVLALE